MRPTILAIAVLVAPLACAPKGADQPADRSSQQAATPSDVASVQRAIDSAEARYSAAMIKGDTATMASLYADDALVFPPGMKVARGRAGISQMNAAMFSSVSYPAVVLTSDDLIVSGDYAIETGSYRMTIQPKQGKAIQDVGKFVSVWKRQTDGSWKMIRDIFNTDQPAG